MQTTQGSEGMQITRRVLMLKKKREASHTPTWADDEQTQEARAEDEWSGSNDSLPSPVGRLLTSLKVEKQRDSGERW
jgi:hypothetical protein